MGVNGGQLDNTIDNIFARGSGKSARVLVSLGVVKSKSKRKRYDWIETLRKLLEERVDNRKTMQSPRQLLPEGPFHEELYRPRQAIGSGQGSTDKRNLREQSINELRERANDSFAAFDSSPVVKEVLAERAARGRSVLRASNAGKAVGARLARRSDDSTSSMKKFYAARSVALELGKDQVARLLKRGLGGEVPLRGVYPIRTLLMPPRKQMKNAELPPGIHEIQAAAWGIEKIGALAVWGAYDIKGKGSTVAVLDSGCDGSHPDLEGKIAAYRDFLLDDPSSSPQSAVDVDAKGHGTHVCGTIAGGNKSGRWIGVAPECRLVVATVINPKKPSDEVAVLAALDWALMEHGADVINLSLGCIDDRGVCSAHPYSDALLEAWRMGTVVVAATGNDGEQTTTSPGSHLFCLAAGATDPTDRAAGFSGGATVIGPDYLGKQVRYPKPDLSAPGVAVYSSLPGGKYGHLQGTSMAAPHVAGAIALLASCGEVRDIEPKKRAQFICDTLTGTVKSLGEAGQNHRFGWGRLDVLRAVGYAVNKLRR